MKTVLTYGTFDLFHIGHLNILRRASELGDRLIVGVSTDEFNAIKGKFTSIPYEDRAEIVKAIRHVNQVIPESCWEQKRHDILDHSVSCLVMGNDWAGKFDELRDVCEVIYLPRTEEISTTQLKSSLCHPLEQQFQTRRIRLARAAA
jgi:glycerol-3-phosphate cytidylyltransferase